MRVPLDILSRAIEFARLSRAGGNPDVAGAVYMKLETLTSNSRPTGSLPARDDD